MVRVFFRLIGELIGATIAALEETFVLLALIFIVIAALCYYFYKRK